MESPDELLALYIVYIRERRGATAVIRFVWTVANIGTSGVSQAESCQEVQTPLVIEGAY